MATHHKTAGLLKSTLSLTLMEINTAVSKKVVLHKQKPTRQCRNVLWVMVAYGYSIEAEGSSV